MRKACYGLLWHPVPVLAVSWVRWIQTFCFQPHPAHAPPQSEFAKGQQPSPAVLKEPAQAKQSGDQVPTLRARPRVLTTLWLEKTAYPPICHLQSSGDRSPFSDLCVSLESHADSPTPVWIHPTLEVSAVTPEEKLRL